MNSKKPSGKSLSASSKFSGKAVVTKPKAEPVNPTPIVTKKPLTKNDRELLEACETGDIDQVYVKLWDKANVNCKRPVYGSTPLAVACRKGHAKIVNVLLEFGASMNSDEFGCSPLHWAANSGKPQIISSLIKKAHLSIDDLQKKDQFGSTALHFASVRNLNENISAGSNPMITNNDGKKPSDVTLNGDIRGMLLEKEQKIEQTGKNAKKGKRSPKIVDKIKPVQRSLPEWKEGKLAKKVDSAGKKCDSAGKPSKNSDSSKKAEYSVVAKAKTPPALPILTKSSIPK